MNKYKVLAYYFPNFHHDDRNALNHGKNWNEWELVKNAKPRFEHHDQPKIPLWGYEDESNPAVMEKKIKAAAENGLNGFIFDWYYYEDGTFLEKCLTEGFLKAKNCNQMQFALMWANHDWREIMPVQRVNLTNPPLLYNGVISVNKFREMTDYIIKNYFSRPNYLRINGGLYFSVYDLGNFLKSLGGIENAKKEIELFRQKTRDAGLGEINLNFIVIGQSILVGEKLSGNIPQIVEELHADSVASYAWLHDNEFDGFPLTDYEGYAKKSIHNFENIKNRYTVPYYPVVSMGWDSSPRTIASDPYEEIAYPYVPVLAGNSPDKFENALEQTKEFLDRNDETEKIVLINAFNEWTEGSYLEPDTKYQYGYLKAIDNIFNERS